MSRTRSIALSAAIAVMVFALTGEAAAQAAAPITPAAPAAAAPGVAAKATPERRPKVVTGKTTVVDGDTIRVGLAVIRLWGVDAPEITECKAATVVMKPFCGTPGAEGARRHLEQAIAGAEVKCEEVSRDSFGQMMGECFAGKVNLGLEQIRSGNAAAWPTYLRQNALLAVPYPAAEAEARASRRGLWQ